MATWLEFKTDTKKLLTDLTATDDLYAAACAAYVKAMICREVDHDPVLSKSYYNSFLDLRRRLLGFTTALAVGSTLDAAVKIHIPVDAQREGIQTYLTQLIKVAHQEISSLSVLIERLIREAVIDLQSYVACYRVGESTTYTDTDVVAVGNFSRGAMPDQAELLQGFLLEEIDALAEGTDYEAGDYVSSNGRTYMVLNDGQLEVGELGAGLTSTDGSVEELGGLDFTFFYGEACLRSNLLVRPWSEKYNWNYLRTGCESTDTPAMIAIDKQAYSFYLWPQLEAGLTAVLTWSGLKFDFADGDTVPFDESAQQAVREFVLSRLLRQTEQDRLLSQEHERAYLALRTRLYLDCRARQSINVSK